MILLGLLLACADPPEADTGPCGRTPPLTWDNFGRTFMEKHCTGCHSSLLRADQRNAAPTGVDLDSYDDAMRWADRIDARTLAPEVPTMPPGGGPTAEELARLAEWLTCGVRPDAAAMEGTP